MRLRCMCDAIHLRTGLKATDVLKLAKGAFRCETIRSRYTIGKSSERTSAAIGVSVFLRFERFQMSATRVYA